VAGPGDEVYTYFPDKITSVKGYWQTPAANVQVLNAQELDLAPVPLKAGGKNDTWGQKISVSSRGSKTSTKPVWVKVQLPQDANLEGKTLRLKMDLLIRYPELNKGGDNAHLAEAAFSHTASLRLSSPRAGERYRSWWWGGMITGALLLTVSGVLVARLSSALRQKALPTDIFVPGQEEAQAAQEGGPPPEAAPPPPGPGEGRPDDRVRE
jgi:hypothetical protein